MTIDIQIVKDEESGLFDFSIENGDIKTIDSFDTSLAVALFADQRASQSEVPVSQNRRGWWGSEFSQFPGFEIGSKLWLLNQERTTQSTLNKAISYAQNALQWLVNDNFAKEVTVSGQLNNSGITLIIKIYRSNGVTETRYFDLWNNTGMI